MQLDSGDEKQGAWKAWIWMAACRVPMIVIVFLIALGYWSFR